MPAVQKLIHAVMQRNGERMHRAGMLVQSCLGGAEKDCKSLEALIAEYKVDQDKVKRAGPQFHGMAMGLHNPCFQIPRGLGPKAPETRLGERLGCAKL